MDEGTVRRLYYVAMANCLWADMLISSDAGGAAGAARRVLLLFLDPDSEENAEEQMEIIRAGMDETLIERMSAETGLPADFIAYLTLGNDEHGSGA